MTDEEFVRANWDYVEIALNRELGQFVFFTNNALYQAIFADSPAELFARGAEFTKERQAQIVEVEEEIQWVEAESSMSDGFPYPAALRVLTRLESALTDLRKGMRA